MNSSCPLLTIAIPTYNRARMLGERLEEIFPQLTRELEGRVEVLVCDDGSTDNTEAVCARYRERGVRYYRNPVNLGLSQNMLQTFLQAQGEWIWTLGDDDSLVQGGVQGGLDLITKYSDAAVICFRSFGNGIREERAITSLAEMLERLDIGDVMFMSSNLYRLDKVRQHLKTFAQAAITIAPHVALIERVLETQGSPLQLSLVELLAIADEGKRWSSMELSLGMCLLPEFVRDRGVQRQAALAVWCAIQWKLVYGLREVVDHNSFTRWKLMRRRCMVILKSYGVGYCALLRYCRFRPAHLKSHLKSLLISWMPFGVVKNLLVAFRRKQGGDKVSFDN